MPPTWCLDARCCMAPRHCGYPADSIDLATGAAGEVTSTPSSHQRRPNRGSRLTPGPVLPATWTSQNVACQYHHYTRGQERLRGYLHTFIPPALLPLHLPPIYNTFKSYTGYITRKVLYSRFCCLYNWVRPVLGINHNNFFWLCRRKSDT